MREKSGPSNKFLASLQRRAEKIHADEPAYKKQINRETLIMLIFAVLTALALNIFVFKIIRVDGPSMEPTFWTNERVFVDKVTYRFREPKRNEVVICYYAHNGLYIKGDDPVIKRVIALEGETVSIVGGKIYVDDQELDESVYWQGTIDRDMAPYIVPRDSIFVVGDNRNRSMDSRDPSILAVQDQEIMGIVRFRIWPLQKIGFFDAKHETLETNN